MAVSLGLARARRAEKLQEEAVSKAAALVAKLEGRRDSALSLERHPKTPEDEASAAAGGVRRLLARLKNAREQLAQEERQLYSLVEARRRGERPLEEIQRLLLRQYGKVFRKTPVGLSQKGVVQQGVVRWIESGKPPPNLTMARDILKSIKRDFDVPEAPIGSAEPERFWKIQAAKKEERRDVRLDDLALLRQQDPFVGNILSLHSGEVIFIGQPRALRGAGPLRDAIEHHRIDDLRPGCPTCARISRVIRAPGVGPEEVFDITNKAYRELRAIDRLRREREEE